MVSQDIWDLRGLLLTGRKRLNRKIRARAEAALLSYNLTLDGGERSADWPWNLFKAVFGHDCLLSLAEDGGISVHMVLSRLTDQERAVIYRKYQIKADADGIRKGLLLNGADASPTRARKLHNSAIEKLRQPNILRRLTFGIHDTAYYDTKSISRHQNEISDLTFKLKEIVAAAQLDRTERRRVLTCLQNIAQFIYDYHSEGAN
jgi:hypothetical protein